MSHYHIERKRAAVAVFRECKRLKTEHHAKWLNPIEVASVASGGASRDQIYRWQRTDLSEQAQAKNEERRGRPPALSKSQEALLVGSTVCTRSVQEGLSLHKLQQFSSSYLSEKLSLSTLSRIMREYGFSSQKAMSRNSRMISPQVVEDAVACIEEIRDYDFPPHRILAMDETGLWSNVTAPRTCHFKNWFNSFIFFIFRKFHFPEKIIQDFCPLLSPGYFALIGFLLFTTRSNAVVEDTGDRYRDTLALTVRADGLDIPPFIIVHTYKTASYASGRRCRRDETPIKGMNTSRMIAYIDHISDYIEETSLLLLDLLSSHHAGKVRAHIASKKTRDGDPLIIPIFLPAKTAFLISPLDMGANAAFKSYFYRYDRSTIELKLRAVDQAWGEVSNQSLRNICLNCGITGEESIDAIRERFQGEVVGLIPEELEHFADFYDSWISGAINVEGATRGRGVTLISPDQLSEGFLDGVYWTNYGRGSSSS